MVIIVSPADRVRDAVTEAGVKRALAKLEALKPHIVWWESGSQPPKRLATGETSMSTAFNGRIAAANRDASVFGDDAEEFRSDRDARDRDRLG